MSVQNHSGKVTCIRAGTLIDVRRGRALKKISILVLGNRIEWVKQGFSSHLPEGAVEIDASKRVVLPGLIDMHVHVKNEYQLKLFVKHGVTTVRDVGNNLRKIKALSASVNAGKLLGPRIFFAGPLIDGIPEKVRKNEYFPDMNIGVSNEQQAAKAAARLLGQGVSCLKVYQNMQEKLIRAVVREAKKKQIPVAAHSGIGSTIGQAVSAGVSTVEHVHRIATELVPEVPKQPWLTGPFSMMHPWACVDLHSNKVKQLLKLMAKRKVYFDPTLVVIDKMAKTNDPDFLGDPDFLLVDSKERREWEEENKPFLKNVRGEDFYEAKTALKLAQGFVGKAFRAGVSILAGSDNGMPYAVAGKSLHEELQLLSECGIANMEVLRVATISAAAALHRAKDLGAVEEGKLADMIILRANPLENVANTTQISCVIKDGKVMKF